MSEAGLDWDTQLVGLLNVKYSYNNQHYCRNSQEQLVAGITTTHLYGNTKPHGDISNATAKVDQHYCRNSQQQLVAGTTTTHLYGNTKPHGDISNAAAKVENDHDVKRK